MKTASFQFVSMVAACLATACLTVASSSAPAKASPCSIVFKA